MIIHLERRRAVTPAAFLLLALCSQFVLSAAAGTPDQQKVRVQRIEDSVLAPCCYTEPVSRHQSEIAVKMRIEIVKWVAAGKTDQEILDAYVQLYGSKVLVDPRTIPAWWTPCIPWFALALGAVLVLWLLKRWRSNSPPPDPPSNFEGRALPDIEDEDSPGIAG